MLGLTLTVLLAYSCYDDSWVRESIEKIDGTIESIENRFQALEKSCNELNEEMQAMAALVNAVNTGDMIKSVKPLVVEGGEVGYTIEFVKGGTINIYHGADGQNGKDGVDGTRPDLGIRKDNDGVYYWTLNNDWLLDSDGNKIKAVATDGAPGQTGATGAQGAPGQTGATGEQGPKGEDGITPKLKIENDYWYVSYDNGVTWEEKPLGKAVGEDGADGADGGDSVFSSVKVEESYVSFTLKTGETFNISKVGGSLNIIFDVEQGVAIVPGTTLKFGYTVIGGDENTLVRTVFTSELAIATVKPIDAKSGYIYIYVDEWSEPEDESDVFDDEMFGTDITTGDFYDSMRSILISVSDGKNNQVLKSLNIVKGKFEGVQDAFCVDAEAGEFVTALRTNVLEGSYRVDVPKTAKSWLTYVPGSKATMRNEELKFRVTANTESKFRATSVSLKNDLNQTMTSFVIAQRSVNAKEVIKFEDELVEQVCVARYDKDGSGDLTYEELALVTDVDGLFNECRYLSYFNEFQYFTSVTKVPESMFSGCENLKAITLPETIVEIGYNAFAECRSLTSITLPSALERIENHAFANSGLRGMIEIPAAVKYIAYGAFEGTQITEAKMWPVKPPVEYDNTSILPYGTVMYVPDESVEAYKKAYLYGGYDSSRYTILPMSMLDSKISFAYESLDEATYVNGSFRFPMNVTLTGDISKLSNVSDYGYFYDIKRRWNDYADYQYVTLKSLNSARKVNLRVNYDDYYSSEYEIQEYEDYIEFTARMGAYVRFEDGTVIHYDAIDVPLKYSSNVWIDFTGVENVRFDDYLSFTLSYNAGGTFFLESEYGGKSVTKATWTKCMWRLRHNDSEQHIGVNNTFADGNNRRTTIEIPINPPTNINETLYFTLTLMDDYERISETIHFAYSPDGTITAQLEGEDDDNNSDLDESLSNYSVRLNTFEQKWSSYEYINDPDAPGYSFFHGMKLCVEADEKLLENSQEVGVYCRYGEGYAYTSTIPLTSGVVNEDYYYYFTKDFYNYKIEEAYASYDVYIGTYAILTDGTAVTYNEQPFTFSYDRKPEVTLLDSKRNLYSAEVTEGIKYSYDDAGNVTDSTMVKEMLYNYNDTLRFNVSGGAWIANMYHANKNSQKTYYRLIADEIYDGSFYWSNFWGVWGSDSSRTISEYILYYDYTIGGWKTSTNQLIPTWYSDNTCSLEVYDKTPEDSHVITTKSLVPNKGPVATKGKTVIEMINVDDSNRSKCKPANMKRSL